MSAQWGMVRTTGRHRSRPVGPQVTAGLSTVCVPSEGSLGRDRGQRLDRELCGGQQRVGGQQSDLQGALGLVEYQVHLIELPLGDGPVGHQQAHPWNGTHRCQSQTEGGMREKPPSTPANEHKESREPGQHREHL